MKRLALSSICPDVAPCDWCFQNGPHGKPAVAGMECPPHFNISHTRNVAVCAVTTAGPVGIDAEPLSRGADVLRVLDCFTTLEERASITQPEDAVWLWTAKEALVKASGEGLTGIRRSTTWLPLTRWTINRRYAVTVAASSGARVTPVALLATDHLAAAAEPRDASDCWAH